MKNENVWISSHFRHHYAVNVNFPVVSLVVDGEEWTDQKDNPEIIDDWPLHNAGDITTKISIGACWQGITHIRSQKFRFIHEENIKRFVVVIRSYTYIILRKMKNYRQIVTLPPNRVNISNGKKKSAIKSFLNSRYISSPGRFFWNRHVQQH